MTAIQKRAFEMIRRLPDDKVYHIVQLLEGMDVLASPVSDGEKTLEQMAYEDLQKFRRCSEVDIDYKAELAQAREEKYAGID
ncbi:MAG: hypothetical protein NC124_11145 [Clostridium sp.]|nr:hypothetical protein [Clostridium sp.]